MKITRKTAGFTLIEIMIALTILAIAMLGFVPMVISIIRTHSFGNKMTKAAELAQDKLEEIRRMEFADPRIVPRTYTEPVIDNIYTRSYTVSLSGGTGDIKTVSVSVNWRDVGRPPQNTTYVTTKVQY